MSVLSGDSSFSACFFFLFSCSVLFCVMLEFWDLTKAGFSPLFPSFGVCFLPPESTSFPLLCLCTFGVLSLCSRERGNWNPLSWSSEGGPAISPACFNVSSFSISACLFLVPSIRGSFFFFRFCDPPPFLGLFLYFYTPLCFLFLSSGSGPSSILGLLFS